MHIPISLHRLRTGRKLIFSSVLLLLCCLLGCKGTPQNSSNPKSTDDLQQIKDSGELTVLTLYSSTSYFIYRG